MDFAKQRDAVKSLVHHGPNYVAGLYASSVCAVLIFVLLRHVLVQRAMGSRRINS